MNIYLSDALIHGWVYFKRTACLKASLILFLVTIVFVSGSALPSLGVSVRVVELNAKACNSSEFKISPEPFLGPGLDA